MFWKKQIQLIEVGGSMFLQGYGTRHLLSGVRKAPKQPSFQNNCCVNQKTFYYRYFERRNCPPRYRHGGRERDHRNYSDSSSNNRKLSGSYFEGPSDYGRSYGRNQLEYDRLQDYDRNRDHEPEPDLRDSRDSRMIEARHPRDPWDRDRDRDVRHSDDRRDAGDSKKDAFERHVSILSFKFYILHT